MDIHAWLHLRHFCSLLYACLQLKDRFRKVCYSFTSKNIHSRLNRARQQLQPTSMCFQHQTAALLTVLSSLGGSSLAWYPPLPVHLCNYCSGQEVGDSTLDYGGGGAVSLTRPLGTSYGLPSHPRQKWGLISVVY